MAVATERDVEVVAQPGGKGDVPATPEVGETNRRVGEAEVVRHRKTQTQRRPDRRGRVAGEVAKDLSAEGERSRPRIERARDLVAVEDALGHLDRKLSASTTLLNRPSVMSASPKRSCCAAGAARLGELRHELGGTHDGAGDQVREEGHEQGVIEQVPRRCRPPQVHVERVRHGREGIEGNADRQDDVVVRGVVGDAHRAHERTEIVEQELAVLEVAEHAEIGDHREQHPGVPGRGAARLHEPLCRVPVDDGRNPQQYHERRVPRRVEEVAGKQEIDFLRGPRQRQRVQPEHAAKNTMNVSELKTMPAIARCCSGSAAPLPL